MLDEAAIKCTPLNGLRRPFVYRGRSTIITCYAMVRWQLELDGQWLACDGDLADSD
jgi:hypothetical protein